MIIATYFYAFFMQGGDARAVAMEAELKARAQRCGNDDCSVLFHLL